MKMLIPVLCVLITTLSFANTPWKEKISPALEWQTAGGAAAPCIVLLAEQASLTDIPASLSKDEKGRLVFERLQATAARTQAPIQQFLQQHGLPSRPLYIVNAIGTTATYEQLEAIARRPEVAAVTDDPRLRMPRVDPLPQSSQTRQAIEWGVLRIRANEVWELGFRGEGVVIGGQDTGYDVTHPALIHQYRGSQGDTLVHDYNWYDAVQTASPQWPDSIANPCGLSLSSPCDDNNHGTHTMGTMVGDDGAGNQIGVAPGARWIGVRNMDRGVGSPFTYLTAFQWFLAPTDVNGENARPERAPHVINNSWYCPESEGCNDSNRPAMELAVNNLRAAGIVVVVSAGNSGPGCHTINEIPSAFRSAFAVGATDNSDTITSFSSRGPVYLEDSTLLMKPDVVAPGRNVRSALIGDRYAGLSGTSMSAPHVAGTVALMISANPGLAGQVDTIEAILRRTAVPIAATQACGPTSPQAIPNPVYGYGRIDAFAAVQDAIGVVISSVPSSLRSEKIRLFPNPTSDEVTLQGLIAPAFLRLFSATGQPVVQRAVDAGSTTLSTTNLPAGIYFYTLSRKGKISSGKLLKVN